SASCCGTRSVSPPSASPSAARSPLPCRASSRRACSSSIPSTPLPTRAVARWSSARASSRPMSRRGARPRCSRWRRCGATDFPPRSSSSHPTEHPVHLPRVGRDRSRNATERECMSPSKQNGASTLTALSDDLADAVERAGRSVVAIHARPRIPASGVYWREGVIVATSHTIRRESDITITLPGGGTARAQLAGRDGGTDLAVLRLDSVPSDSTLALSDRADADSLRVGSLVLAVGRPGSDGVSASLGVVSTVGDKWRTWSGGEIDRFVRLDLAIYDGFSGGALVDADGRIAGVNCSALARGIPLTIPSVTVDRVVDALLTRGHVA